MLGLPVTVGFAPTLTAQARPRKKPEKPPEVPVDPPAAPGEGAQAPVSGPVGEGAGGPSLRRSNRMEFDARLVQGERAQGAVYLFQRVPRALPGLVNRDPRYLDRIVQPVLGVQVGGCDGPGCHEVAPPVAPAAPGSGGR